MRANSARRSAACRGIGPSVWLARYVVCSRIGNSERYVEEVAHEPESARDGRLGRRLRRDVPADVRARSVDEERTRAEALGAASLAEPSSPAPRSSTARRGFGRHALVRSPRRATVVTGLDRSAQLTRGGRAPARRRGVAAVSCAATTASCRSPTRASTRSSTCSRRSATSSATRTSAFCASSVAFCGPGGALVVETAHRDGFARLAQPFARRTWEPLPDGSLYLEERTPTGRQGRSTRTA